ncbi:MAG: hypothetical protein ACJ788_18210 [Ktedonobacteraceae bacterium]
MRLRCIAIFGGSVILVLFLLLILITGKLIRGSEAQQPARSETLAVGPYITEVNLYANPPQVGQPVNISIVTRDSMHLTGQIIALPRPGTDASKTHTLLIDDTGHANTLKGSIQLPVRGAWQLLIELDGSKGHGTASLDVEAVVPNALPPWLGWLLGLSPLLGCAWLIWHQWRYRRRLMATARSA